MNLACIDNAVAEFIEKTTDALVGIILEGVGQVDVVSREDKLGAGLDGIGHEEGRRRRIVRGMRIGEGRCRQGSQQEEQEGACHGFG